MDAGDWDRRYAGRDLVWSATPNQFVVAELEALAPGTALDLACGEGRNALWLANRGWRVTGADFSRVALDKAAALAERALDAGAPPVTWVCADATAPPVEGLPAEGVDLVVMAYLQLPAAQRRSAVRRAAAVLAPGGHLLVVAHDLSNLTDGFGGPQDAGVLYTAPDVLADLSGRTFDTLRAERVPRTVEVDGSPRTAWDLVVHLVASA